MNSPGRTAGRCLIGRLGRDHCMAGIWDDKHVPEGPPYLSRPPLVTQKRQLQDMNQRLVVLPACGNGGLVLFF